MDIDDGVNGIIFLLLHSHLILAWLHASALIWRCSHLLAVNQDIESLYRQGEEVECAEESTQFGISSHHLALKVYLAFLRLILVGCHLICMLAL